MCNIEFHSCFCIILIGRNQTVPSSSLKTVSDCQTSALWTLWSTVSGAPPSTPPPQLCISNRHVGGLLQSSHLLSPRLPPGMWVERGPLLSHREIRAMAAFILLHTRLKRSQVQRGRRDPPRATLKARCKGCFLLCDTEQRSGFRYSN